MIKLLFIRHGMTLGNLEKRYIGSTDERLCPQGILTLQQKHLPNISQLFSSPMTRCLETCQILFPDTSPHIIANLREKDFGRYEGLSFLDLQDDYAYQQFLNSGGELPFPSGECTKAFKQRTLQGFQACLEKISIGEDKDAIIAFVVHGGTIMTILEAYEESGKAFYHWQIPTGQGILCSFNTDDRLHIEDLL